MTAPSSEDDDLAFLIQLEENRSKVGKAMLSSRYQRFEVNVTGKQAGPDSLAKSEYRGIDQATPRALPHASPRTDDGAASDGSPRGTRRRVEYARFFPSANGGEPTPTPRLKKLNSNANALHLANARHTCSCHRPIEPEA